MALSKVRIKFFSMQVVMGNLEYEKVPNAYKESVKKCLKDDYNMDIEKDNGSVENKENSKGEQDNV